MTSVTATGGGGLATVPGGGITATGSVGITAGGVQTTMLADSAVTGAKQADSAVTNAKIAPQLDKLVRRCLEKKPERRFQTASDLGFALEALTMPSGSQANAAPVSSFGMM